MFKALDNCLKQGFFEYLSQELDIENEKIHNLWVVYTTKIMDKPEISQDQVVEYPEKTVEIILKHVPRRTSRKGIAREEQTPVQKGTLPKLTVVELRKICYERGLQISGNKAILVESIAYFEENYGTGKSPLPNHNKKSSGISLGTGKKQHIKPVMKLFDKVQEYETSTDKYGNDLLGDLVISKEFGEPRAVGFIDADTDNILPLDKQHIEKCKELNILFQHGDFDV